MRFAKLVFGIAGAWGLIVIFPLYFLLDSVGRLTPPPVTHPEYYYGFVGVAMAWQLAFLVIASAPDRFRPMMIPSVLEKLGFAFALIVTYLQHRITSVQVLPAIPDGLFAILFTMAFVKTKARDTA